MTNVLIIADHKYGEPASIVIERKQDHLWYGYIPAQGNQPVSLQTRNIRYLGDQPVIHDRHIQHERGY